MRGNYAGILCGHVRIASGASNETGKGLLLEKAKEVVVVRTRSEDLAKRLLDLNGRDCT
jgi:hypothetical protein